MSFSLGSLVQINHSNHDDELYFAWSSANGIPPGEVVDESLDRNLVTSVPKNSIGIVLACRQGFSHELVYTLIGSEVIVFNSLELRLSNSK